MDEVDSLVPSRIIRDSARTSATLDQLSDGAERMFWRLTLVADDHGRFEADPRVLLASCFPLKVGKLKLERVTKWWLEMVDAGLVRPYRAGDKLVGYFPTWGKHQRTRDGASRFPEPPEQPGPLGGGPPHDAASCGTLPPSAALGMGYGVLGIGYGEEGKETLPGAPQNGAPAWGTPEALIRLYNEQRPSKAAPFDETVPDPDIRRKAAAILKVVPEQERWACVMTEVNASPFLRGEVDPVPPRTRRFRLTFDFLLGSDRERKIKNVTKILEGRYSDRRDPPSLRVVPPGVLTPKTQGNIAVLQRFIARGEAHDQQ